MHVLLLIGIGGFIGAILRYLIGGYVQTGSSLFPIGTLTVNFIGSFLLGITLYLSEYRGFFTEEARIFLTIGILGAFTTMSTFSYESFKLLEEKEFLLLTLNVLGTIMLTFLAVYLGKLFVNNVWGN